MFMGTQKVDDHRNLFHYIFILQFNVQDYYTTSKNVETNIYCLSELAPIAFNRSSF